MPDSQYRIVARPFRPQRGPRAAAVGALIFLLVALIKPWPDSPEERAADRAAPTAAIAAASVALPSPTPSPGPNAMPCLAGAETQVVAMERSVGRSVRSWIAVVDEIAPGAEDLHEPPITVFSSAIVGIGVCGDETVGAAGRTPGPSGDAAVLDPQAASLITVVRSSSSGAADLADLGVGAPLPGQDAHVDGARLYGPPLGAAMVSPDPVLGGKSPPPHGGASPEVPGDGSEAPRGSADDSIDREPVWRPGSYAIAFRYQSDGPSIARWVRLVILANGTTAG